MNEPIRSEGRKPLAEDHATDVVVVGGGLAGLSAAMVLARRGVAVTVVEQKRFPFHRLCGEFLSPEFRALLDAIGFDDVAVLAQGAVPVRRMRFTAASGAELRDELPGLGAGLSRHRLDRELARQAASAGARIWDGARALTCETRDGFTTIETERGAVRSRRVVFATGKLHAQWRRLAGNTGGREPVDRGTLIGIKLHGVLEGLGDVVEIHAFRGGYCGFVEIEEQRVNLCLLARMEVFEPHRAPLAFLEAIASENPALGERIGAFRATMDTPIVQSNFATGPLSERRPDVMLAGDADGMISPLAGEGMCMALRSGRSAGVVMADHLAGRYDWCEAMRRYDAAMRREKLGLLRLGNGLQSVLFHPASASAAIRLLAAVDPLRHFVMRATRRADTALPRSVMR